MKLKILALALLSSGLVLGTGVASAAGVTVKKLAVAAPVDTLANPTSEQSINNDITLTPKQKLLLILWWRKNHPHPSDD